MKIAMLLNKSNQKKTLNEKTIGLLQQKAELVWNETDGYDQEELKRVIRGADAAVTSWGCPKLTADILKEAPDLKLILHAAGSVKPFITEDIFDRGIRVISSASVLSCGVSETALGFIISASKNFYELNDKMHAGVFRTQGVKDLFDLTIGIVGFGYAGRHLAELLQAFQVDVIASDPGVSAQSMVAVGVRKVEMEEVFEQSDIISIHAPELPSTYHIVNEASIASMKDGVILINTARGTAIDEQALAKALLSGKIKTACLDVYDPEPPCADNPLLKLDNCIMTPHIAGQAANGLQRIGYNCYCQLLHFLAGERMQGEITRDMLNHIA